MRGDMVSELRLAALYVNQVTHAIVRMDDRQSIYIYFFNTMRSTHNTFAIYRLIAFDVLGTTVLDYGTIASCHTFCGKMQLGHNLECSVHVLLF